VAKLKKVIASFRFIKNLRNYFRSRKLAKTSPGQITINSESGRLLHNFISNNEIVDILEIGTYNGLGTTKLILDAMKAKNTEFNFTSIESDKIFYKEAVKNLKRKDKEILDAKEKAGTISVTVVSDTKGFNPVGKIAEGIKSGPEQVTEKNKREAAALKKINTLQNKILQKLDAKDIERFLRIKNGAGSNVGKFNQLKTFERKVKNMNVGGLTSPVMVGGEKKINPTTGLSMNKGGMTDYRKSGMFYGGGMAKRGR